MEKHIRDLGSIDCIVGKNIAKERRQNGFTQEALEEHCSISRAYLGKVELGQHSLTVKSLKMIADALGVKIADLFK